MKKLNKNIHFSCSNCQQKAKVRFSNNVIICSGLTKKQHFPNDYYRFCIEKNKNRSCNDIMEEELLALLQGLSTILLEHKIKKINKK